MKTDSQILNDYLVSDASVDWKPPTVLQTARALTNSISDEVEKARSLPGAFEYRG